MRAGLAPALSATLVPAAASAHGFGPAGSAYALFVEGASAPWMQADLLLCLLPLGVLMGLWRPDAWPLLWPSLITGLVAGMLAGPLLPGGVGIAPLGLGLIASGLAAAMLPYPRGAMRGLTGLAGGVAGAAALGQTQWLPVWAMMGVVLGSCLAVALSAAAVVTTRREIPAGWLVVGWRIAASWLGAMAIMIGAFRLT